LSNIADRVLQKIYNYIVDLVYVCMLEREIYNCARTEKEHAK